MKYVVLLCDGMADLPVPALGGKTPIEVARKPNMDALARHSEVGLCKTVPDGFSPGSDVANLSVMGYDPAECYTGRSPLEAASIGVQISDTDIAFRCNLVTLSAEPDYESRTMIDYSAGDISTEEAAQLIAAVQDNLGSESFSFHPGVSYRHCLIWHRGADDAGEFTPPHNISGQPVVPHLNRHPAAAALLDLMKKSAAILEQHPVNQERIAQGKRPANSIWLWGQGRAPRMVPYADRFSLQGSVISAVDLVKGVGVCAGLTPVAIPGATGYLDTNYAGKVAGALAALDTQDFVYVHVEAPDETAHEGRTDLKIRAIEDFDRHVVAPCLAYVQRRTDARLLVAPDHVTAISTKTHAGGPVPFALCGAGVTRDDSTAYTEPDADRTGLVLHQGHRLTPALLQCEHLSAPALQRAGNPSSQERTQH